MKTKIIKLRIDIFIALFLAIFFTLAANRDYDLEKFYGMGEFLSGGREEIILNAMGDIMLSRVVEQKMLEYNDFSYPFKKIYPLAASADIVFGNLESPILEGRIIKSGEMIFRADPRAVEGLKLAGFNVLNLANNHILNFGKDGLSNTIEVLEKNNISYIGAGLKKENISKPAIKNIKGVRFAFLGYTYNFDQRKSTGGEIYGSANMDIEQMKKDVEKAKENSDIVIVSMHAGEEYSISSGGTQRNFARAAIDSGASLVIGHHPHVVQNAEKYKDGYILYSLGNFVFDQMWSEETRLGVIAKIYFNSSDKKVSGINFIPIKIYDYSQPRITEKEEAKKILDRLKLK